MEYNYSQCTRDELSTLIEEYAKTLSSPFDSFLEDHIDESIFFKIHVNELLIGYFAVHNEKLLTQFYLKNQYLKHSQAIFNEVLNKYQIKEAFVSTCDELFLSLVMDKDIVYEKQAYFFQDSKVDVSGKVYMKGDFRLATKNDYDKIVQMSGDFFDKLEERIERNEIFVFTEDDYLLGAGIIEKGRVLKNHTSIGMFTNEQFRRQGVGRSIIILLKKWCYNNNQIPICGCWYYNHQSKMTLESAGMITKTRLLYIKFKNKEIKEEE